LIAAGYLGMDALLSCFSLTGYSGGGKKMIAAYEDADRPALYDGPRQYALGQQHKHLPEMQAVTGLENAPVFCPVVADFYSGMEVTVPVFGAQLRKKAGPEELNDFYRSWYGGPLVRCAGPDEDGFLSAAGLSGRDSMSLYVAGNSDRLLLTARYDNLGKGASGAAIECMNLVLGLDPAAGLEL
ncbi:MAG: N-acetyl-gamma-glutamyl-phosphate reductase, partial [Oscillospiraceae bacterium]|nr:N-acetyl-gamma-glutamyl-phosphate reductase [Oscillospiraceae bacterium]